ncbi:MAG: putative protein YaaQ [Anaerolineales bacterium]|nr:putative protein YaaQ [Anaerolineales bacterium]
MKLIIAIVNDNDSETLTQAFTAANFRVTRVASTGGFLRRGVTTMLLGIEDSQTDAVIQIVRNALPSKGEEKRATLFVLPVHHYEQV